MIEIANMNHKIGGTLVNGNVPGLCPTFAYDFPSLLFHSSNKARTNKTSKYWDVPAALQHVMQIKAWQKDVDIWEIEKTTTINRLSKWLQNDFLSANLMCLPNTVSRKKALLHLFPSRLGYILKWQVWEGEKYVTKLMSWIQTHGGFSYMWKAT